MTEEQSEPLPVLIEQYKLYVEMADRISERRVDTNKFYVTLLTGLLALIGLAFEKNWFSVIQDEVLAVGSLIGLLLCCVWGVNIRSYRQLNSCKYQVIYDIEKLLPYQCYSCEWDKLGRGESKRLYYPLSDVEGLVPRFLAIPYGLMLVYALWQIAAPFLRSLGISV